LQKGSAPPKTFEKRDLFIKVFVHLFQKVAGFGRVAQVTAFLFDNFFFAPVVSKKKWKTISAVEDGVSITQTLFAKRVRTPKNF